jgi:soluble lytic murein transglycosylase-like protein
VTLGTFYLRRLVDRFGSFDAALSAYHAGPTRIEDRLARSAPVSFAYTDRVWNAIVALQSRSVT